jgi:hypothetical protein
VSDLAPRAKPTPAAQNALRRRSGVCSLGGAGLFPELCNAPGRDRSGRYSKGSNTTAALPKNDAQFAGPDSDVLILRSLEFLDSEFLIALRSDRDGDAPAGSRPMNQRRRPAHSVKRRTVRVCYGHPPAAPIRLLQRRWGRLVWSRRNLFSPRKKYAANDLDNEGLGRDRRSILARPGLPKSLRSCDCVCNEGGGKIVNCERT